MNNNDVIEFPRYVGPLSILKCEYLVQKFGLEGYGIYRILIEALSDQPQRKISVSHIPSLAVQYNTTPAKVRAVVTDPDLFTIEAGQIMEKNSVHDKRNLLPDEP